MKAPDVIYLRSDYVNNDSHYGVIAHAPTSLSDIPYARVRELTDDECDYLVGSVIADVFTQDVFEYFPKDDFRRAVRAWHAKLSEVQK